MSTDNATTKPDGGASVSTVELGGGYAIPTNSILTISPADSAIWAEVSADGVLTRFDNAICNQLAAEFDPDAPLDQNKAIARLCVALLERAAEIADKQTSLPYCTYGDAIRALSVSPPNCNVTGAEPEGGASGGRSS